MKLCGVVITYYPDIKETANNILRYIDDVDHLIIWENTPIEVRNQYRISLPEYNSKLSYLGIDCNMGIAYPLNRSIEWAKENGYTHILTMDQDSQWQNFKLYRQEIEKCSDETVGMFTPSIYNVDNVQLELLPPITSGSVHPISIFTKTGLFCEDYFIDCIDHEFYYRILLNSLSVRYIPDAHLNHSLGYKQTKRFLNLSFKTTNYSPFRLYHMLRNNIWLYYKYQHCSVLPKGYAKYIASELIIKQVVKIILAEDDKANKVKALLKGLLDGIKSKRRFNYHSQL